MPIEIIANGGKCDGWRDTLVVIATPRFFPLREQAWHHTLTPGCDPRPNRLGCGKPGSHLALRAEGVKISRVCSFLRVAAMMSVSHCKSRAAECLKAAERSSDYDGQKAWRRLADSSMAWSDTLGRLTDPAQEWAPFPRIARDAAPARLPELRWK